MTGELSEPLPDDADVDAAFAVGGPLRPQTDSESDIFFIATAERNAHIFFKVLAVAGVIAVGSFLVKIGVSEYTHHQKVEKIFQEENEDSPSTTVPDPCASVKEAEASGVSSGGDVVNAMGAVQDCETHHSLWGNGDPTISVPG